MEGLILGNRYELIEKIGGGGMAIVYKAKCRLLNRYVAVKILRLEFTNDEEFIKRFQVEAQSAASLSHPNIVSIYDVGQEENIHYIVMEFIDGITLKEYIAKNGSLPWQEAVNIAIQICSAIEHAHMKHIIHRDIKPHNIMLTKGGIAKVTDFGIARAVSSSTITVVGSTIGSVHYFSPEQARGGYIDEKSDLYSLGIALYEMVTGKLPFNGESPVAVALMHIQEAPRAPVELNPDIPAGLNSIILKAIIKEQDQRYQTATDMLNDLKRALKEPEGSFVKLEKQEDAPTKRINAISEQQLAGKEEALNKPDGNKKKKRRDRLLLSLAILTGLVIIGITAVLSYYFLIGELNAQQTAEMPDFTNKNYETIKDDLEKEGFNIKPIRSFKEDVNKDIIYKQDPKPGETYKKNGFTDLKLYISDGPERATIPSVKGKKLRDAQIELSNNGFKRLEEREEFSEVAKGLVSRTDPEGGTLVTADSIVTVYVSKGVEIKKTIVPNLVDLTESEALEKLQKFNLKVGKMYPQDQTSRIDKVKSQKPAAGEEVDESTSVDIWFSQAGEGERVPINERITLKNPGQYKKTIQVRVEVTPSDTNIREIIMDETRSKFDFPLTVEVPIPVGGGSHIAVYLDNELVDTVWRE